MYGLSEAIHIVNRHAVPEQAYMWLSVFFFAIPTVRQYCGFLRWVSYRQAGFLKDNRIGGRVLNNEVSHSANLLIYGWIEHVIDSVAVRCHHIGNVNAAGAHLEYKGFQTAAGFIGIFFEGKRFMLLTKGGEHK